VTVTRGVFMVIKASILIAMVFVGGAMDASGGGRPHLSLKCDLCSAAAWQLRAGLVLASAGKTAGADEGETAALDELEVETVLQAVCHAGHGELVNGVGDPFSWGDYGISEERGDDGATWTVLSGPGCRVGTPAAATAVRTGRGSWAKQLQSRCQELLSDLGEQEIYDEWRRVRAHDQGVSELDHLRTEKIPINVTHERVMPVLAEVWQGGSRELQRMMCAADCGDGKSRAMIQGRRQKLLRRRSKRKRHNPPRGT
jgi:hypothetical protein